MSITYYVRKLLWLLVAGLLLPGLSGRAESVNEKFELLQTKTDLYTNVTVTTKSKEFICILHSRGIGTIKVSELPDDAKERLGYEVERKRAAPGEFGKGVSAQMKRTLAQMNLASVEPLQQAWSETSAKGFFTNTTARNLLLGVLAGLVVAYLIFCYCVKLICEKAGVKAGFLAWLPVVQWLPLLKAAEMPLGWLVGLLLPGINLFVYIYWAVKITKARGKHGVVALLLVLPVINVLAFLFLAFSSAAPGKGGESEKDQPRRGSRAMSLNPA